MIKKLFYIIICSIIFANFASAQTQQGYLDYSGYQYEFRPGDKPIFLNNANKNMKLYEKAQTDEEKSFYLQETMRYFFLLEKIDYKSLDAQIGLGRVYDELKFDQRAKKYFFTAFNLNNRNPRTNFYLASFYYKRSDIISSLYYYKRAYDCGYSKNYDVNYKIGEIYEKLADIENALIFYKKALKLNQQNSDLTAKITQLEQLNYSESQYYLFDKPSKAKVKITK